MTSRDTELTENLLSALTEHDALPYLFIGSGVSRRYLDLPDWEGLLRIFSEKIGISLDFLLASADGDYSKAASALAQEFHEHWWRDEEYKDQVDEFKKEVRGIQGGLKIAVSHYISEHGKLVEGTPGVDDPELSAEISLMKRVVVDGVITTNYDELTDEVFPQFPAYIGQDELLLSDAQFIAETYKIHGSASQPLSIVLTKEDYDQFAIRNHYLAAKLLTIFAEHPVVFIGYSLNDDDLSTILANIVTAVGPERSKELGSRMYFVIWNPDPDFIPSIEASSIERGGSIIPITRIETNSFGWIWSAMIELERPYPAQMLRQLRKHVFDLVTNPEPGEVREEVIAVPFESGNVKDLRVVFGVGQFSDADLQALSEISSRTLKRADLEMDVLEVRERPLGADKVLEHGIPDHIRPPENTYLPTYKYLRESGRIADDGSVNYEGLDPMIEVLSRREILNNEQSLRRFNKEIRGKLTTPREVLDADLAVAFKMDCLIMLDPEDYDLEELRMVLVDLRENDQLKKQITPFRKALCAYDRMKWGESTLHGRCK